LIFDESEFDDDDDVVVDDDGGVVVDDAFVANATQRFLFAFINKF
jgi:hypothetical protein